MKTLQQSEWQALRQEHQDLVEPWIAPRLQRRSLHQSHPVDDFLFEYYPISPAKLRDWHPGMDIQLEATTEDFESFPSSNYEFENGVIKVKDSWIAKSQEVAGQVLEFLQQTAQRPARNGCFGLHEWAMVLGSEDVRHEKWPLRLSQEEIQATIDEVGLRCTHFDAFRFFTPIAVPLNPLQLTRINQIEVEQPGCLHANMDLYKHAQRFAPAIGSELVRLAFKLAKDIRTVDMQVAPYDLLDLGVIPIPVETVEGRQKFAELQLEFSLRAQEIRARLIAGLEAFAFSPVN